MQIAPNLILTPHKIYLDTRNPAMV